MISSADIPLCRLEEAILPSLLPALPATELGAACALLLASWSSACELDARETMLATAARVELDVWRRIQERVTIALDLVTLEGSTRVVLGHARRAQERMISQAAAVRAQKAQAGRIGGLARAGRQAPALAGEPLPAAAAPPPASSTCLAGAKQVLSTCQAPATNLSRLEAMRARVRAGGAHELRELNANDLSSRAEAQPTAPTTAPRSVEPAGDVVARIDADLSDLLAQRLRVWRHDQAKQLLARQCAAWTAKGIDPCWQPGRVIPKHAAADLERAIRRIAIHPNVRPELVAIALRREAEENAASKLGYIAFALGTTRKNPHPLSPGLQDQPLIDEWAAREAQFIAECKVTSAVRNVIARVQQEAPQALHKPRQGGGVA